ncbi:MAG: CsgG/HfaB family protein [Verrucomicrobia bacterium]|nr:CsgG/HfaB family protein [Verrucomicrobiota bacterium]
MNRTLVGVIALALLFSLPIQQASALWGKAQTKTESGNADMKLGEYKGLKHAIGCKEFDNEAGWHGSWKIGDNLSIMLESALYDTGRFVLVEREKLKDVMEEQDLVASGRAAGAKKVAQTGKLRAARYLATGAVTEVEESQSGADGGIAWKGVRLGGGRSEAQVTVIVKLIDTTTGEIVAKERIVGKAGNTAVRVGLDIDRVSTELGGFVKTPLGQAAQDCINKAAQFIAKKMEEFPFEGSVIKVSGNGQVIINRGSEFGVELGQELVMAEQGETLMDPDTGEMLGEEEGELIGKIRVAKVSEKIAYADITEGEQNPAAGTVVRAQ